jgi:septal ring factor EnvC (AmiA/AmiB activator)
MKRDELEKLGLTKEQIDAVMTANGADIEATKKDVKQLTEDVATMTTERNTLQEQLKARDADITELKKASGDNETLTKKYADLQTKYEGETKELNAKLAQQRYDVAAEKAFASVPFASKLARQAALADFKAKGYKLTEDGKFVEAQGYIDTLKTDDPQAFLPDEKDKGGDGGAGGKGEEKPPKFTKPATGAEGGVKPGFFSGGGLNFVREPPATK